MALLECIGNKKNVYYHKFIQEITEEEKKLAMDKFQKYKESGAIRSEFEEDIWEITNETMVRYLNFNINEVEVKKYVRDMSVNELKTYFKYYICFCLGIHSIHVLIQIIGNIKNAMEETKYFTVQPNTKKILQKQGVGEFIQLLPYANEDLIMDVVSNEYQSNRARLLAEYESYFLFENIINKFWKIATEEEKDLYYPIYLWWKIGMIIPIRVTEFTVIPKECIKEKNNKKYLVVRRTLMKGSKEPVQRYKVENDYKLYEYVISDEMVKVIENYMERKKKYKESKGDALISCEMFKETTCQRKRTKETGREYSYLSNFHFQWLLDDFYNEIIIKKYSYLVLTKTEIQMVDETGEQKTLGDNEIIKISLGDTRHIAIQNMLLNGYNILTARELTGHETVNMIFHYAGNVLNLVKCRAYDLYKQSKQEETILEEINFNQATRILAPKFIGKTIDVDLGQCYSPKMVYEYKAHDCFSVGGDCRLCRYLKPSGNMDKFRKDQEEEVKEKIARINMWLTSNMLQKDEKELQIYAEQLKTAVANLELGYLMDYERGENND